MEGGEKQVIIDFRREVTDKYGELCGAILVHVATGRPVEFEKLVGVGDRGSVELGKNLHGDSRRGKSNEAVTGGHVCEFVPDHFDADFFSVRVPELSEPVFIHPGIEFAHPQGRSGNVRVSARKRGEVLGIVLGVLWLGGRGAGLLMDGLWVGGRVDEDRVSGLLLEGGLSVLRGIVRVGHDHNKQRVCVVGGDVGCGGM